MVHGGATLVESLAASSDQLILSHVETSLEISARVSQADVIVVDVTHVPGVLDEVRQLQVHKPVLALVAPGATKEAFDAGCKGAVAANSTPETVAAAVHALAHGLSVVEARELPGVVHAVSAPKTPSDVTLTQRETQVLTRIAEGLSNKEIAAELGVSEHTAKFHVNSILQKFGAQKRVEAVVRAARRGMIQLS